MRPSPIRTPQFAKPATYAGINWGRLPRGSQLILPFSDLSFVAALNNLGARLPAAIGANGSKTIKTRRGFTFGPDGTNTSYVSYQIDQATTFSFEVFFFLNGAPAGQHVVGVNQSNDGSNTTQDRLLAFDNSSHLNWYIFDSVASAGKFVTDTGTAFTTGKFYHVVGTADGTNMRLYINGKESPQSPTACGTPFAGYSPNPFWVFGNGQAPDPIVSGGGNQTSDCCPLVGTYANVAWTASEVYARYADIFGYFLYGDMSMAALASAWSTSTGAFTAKFRRTLSNRGSVGSRQSHFS